MLFTIASFSAAFSQFNETIRGKRPGQSIGAFTVGEGIFQIQSGFDNFSNSQDMTKKGYLNNTVLRYGFTRTFEVSTLVEYRTQEVIQNDTKITLNGLDGMDVGFRKHLYTGKGILPNIGFQFRVRLPVLSQDYKIKNPAPRFIISTSHNFSKTYSLITNWGASWSGNNTAAQGNYTINLSHRFNSKVGVFIENYGSLLQGTYSSYFDGGFAWLVNKDLQLDLYGGYSINRGVSAYFISTGVSWRTKRPEFILKKIQDKL